MNFVINPTMTRPLGRAEMEQEVRHLGSADPAQEPGLLPSIQITPVSGARPHASDPSSTSDPAPSAPSETGSSTFAFASFHGARRPNACGVPGTDKFPQVLSFMPEVRGTDEAAWNELEFYQVGFLSRLST